MAEKHQKTTIVNVADVMAAIFNMVQTSGQTAVRWADTAGGVDGAHALYGTGATFSNATAVAAAGASTFFANTGSYMVIESTATMATSGNRWQVKISRGAANSNLYINFAPRGGWAYNSGTPISSTFTGISTGNLDSFGAALSASNRILISTSDLDTYGSGTTYSYLRVLLWDGTAANINRGFYVGGYIPFDQTNNVNPSVCLVRNPTTTASAALSWAWNASGSSCLNRISPEYTGTTLNLAAAGYAHIKAMDNTIVNRDPNANWVNFPVYLRCIDDSSFFGYFGKYTMFAGDTLRTLATADSANEYLTVNDLVMRWKPSA